MKGLIRNNLYSVSSALKWTLAFCVLINIVILIFGKNFSNIEEFLPILIIGQVGAFVGLTGTVLQKDNSSKWNKYEKILPIKIRKIIMARYISFLLFSIIGILIATLTVIVVSVNSVKPMDLERIGYGYSFGIAFSLLVPSILYPLVLKFGSDKSETMLLISIIVTLFLFNGGSVILTPYLINLKNINIIYRITCIFISMLIFLSSYFISIYIYKRKEF